MIAELFGRKDYNMTRTPSAERERRLDAIRENARYLEELAQHYGNLRWMAEEDASDAFLALTEAAGALMKDSLRQLGNMFEIMIRAHNRTEVKGDGN